LILLDSFAEQIDPWTCKCGFYNPVPPPEAKDCNRCQSGRWGPLCLFHAGESRYPSNDICYSCEKHFRYSDPNYDAAGILLKEAKRAVEICLKTKRSNSDFENPKEMMKDIKNIEERISAGTITREIVIDRCDEILWNACVQIDIRYVADELGSLLNVINHIIADLDKEERLLNRSKKKK